MTSSELDPLIHVPTRLKIVATLAALPTGDVIVVTTITIEGDRRDGDH